MPGRDPLRYRIPNPKSTAREIVGHHGHRPHGKSILWPALYEHLRRKGMTKEKAARISNAAWHKKRMGIPLNTPTSARGLAKSGLLMDAPNSLLITDHSQEEGVPEIKKSDLPPEVVEYIDQLESYAEQVEGENKEVTTKLEASEARVAELEAAGAVADVEKGDPLAEVLAKADPAVRAVFERQQKQLDDQKAIIDKHAEDATTATMIVKASALTKITAPKDELTEMLKSVYAVDQELGDKVYKMLQDANTQIETGALFTELGKTGAQSTVASSVEALAEEIRKTDPTMTREQAIAKAYEANPNLYLEELAKER